MADILNQDKFQVLAEPSYRKKQQIDRQVFGAKVGVFAKLFGCVHENISRPFTFEGTSYRTCLGCGARKQFNSETLQTFGSFYYPPVVRAEN